MGEILPEWIKGKSNSSDLLTKMVAKDVVDALMKTLQGLEPISDVTTRDVKETGDAEKLLSSVMMAEVYDFMSMMAAQQDDEVLRPFDPSVPQRYADGAGHMRGSRDICYTDNTRFSHRTRDDVFPGAVDSTQAATSLPDLTVGRRKYLLMRYPRDQ